MTTMPRSIAVRHERATAAAALATAELQHVLGEYGYPSPGALVRLVPEGDRLRAVVRVPPEVPWRVSDTAAVRALRQARAIHPDVNFADRRFEGGALVDRTVANDVGTLSSTGSGDPGRRLRT
jgi:hypothetical protein